MHGGGGGGRGEAPISQISQISQISKKSMSAMESSPLSLGLNALSCTDACVVFLHVRIGAGCDACSLSG